MSEITDEIERLRTLDRDALIERYRAEAGREPRQKNASWLIRRLAWRAQERRLGGLSATARARLDELIAQIDLRVDAPVVAKGAVTREEKDAGPAVGTTLVRVWRGRTIQVRVTDEGFECDGVVHKSLTAVARAVTGAHWNGNLFFGLRERKRS